MRLHRFYLSPESTELDQVVNVDDRALLNQWLRVFRYREGSEVVLFDGVGTEAIYRLSHIEDRRISLELIDRLERKLPDGAVWVLFSMLKKDKNEWVLQKCTELGVSKFVPIRAEHSEKTGLNMERAKKIIIEAAEQCGRSDIPTITEPMSVDELIHIYRGKVTMLVCDESQSLSEAKFGDGPVGMLIGPEGGWSDAEREKFKTAGLGGLNLGKFTLRAETAAIAAAGALVRS